ncbi:MAG: O-antigen ligase family protein [Candidatus Paceibacterota bacterium]|jgi:O-antigen ligase
MFSLFKSPIWLINLIVFLLPIYLLKIKVGIFSTNFLELLILILLIMQLPKINFRKLGQYVKSNKLLSIGVGLLLTGTFVSTLVSDNLIASLGILKSWFIIPLIFALIIINQDSEILHSAQNDNKKAPSILKSFAFSGITVSIISIFYIFFGMKTYDGRSSAFFLNPNYLAMYLAPAWLIILSLIFFIKNNREKILWITGLLVISIALFFTYSFGTWIGIMAGVTLISILGYKWDADIAPQRRNFTIKKIIPILSFLILLSFLIITVNSSKFQNTFISSRSSLNSRLMIWQSSLHILKDHWVLGIGPGNFQEYYLAYQKYFPPYLEWAVPQPHNIFLAFWLQSGILGIAGFIIIIIWFYKKGLQEIMENKKNASQIYVRLILISIMTYTLVHGLIDTTYWKNDLSMTFWIVIALMSIASHPVYFQKRKSLPCQK